MERRTTTGTNAMPSDTTTSQRPFHEIDLPEPPKPLGAYVAAVQQGALLFLSGMLPTRDGKPVFQGRVGAELSETEAREAATLAARNALAVARQAAGSLDRIARVVRLTVHLATTPAFVSHARVSDAASDVFLLVLGRRGEHARLALGAGSLPGGMPVELEVVLAIKDG
jgi:enamine deaminase RidA (YjgF/YER057c/UK114 family)